jgi:hypothetical protein
MFILIMGMILALPGSAGYTTFRYLKRPGRGIIAPEVADASAVRLYGGVNM